MNQRLLIVVNADWFFLSHRLPIAIEAQRQGFEVHVATGLTNCLHDLQCHGMTVHPLSLERSSVSVASAIHTIVELWRIFRSVRPDVVHLVTIKPVLYGGLAARLARVPSVVAAISGLGSVFVAQGTRARVVRRAVEILYRLALGHQRVRVIFQNPDDRDALVALGAVQTVQSVLIRGSGVALQDYPVHAEPDGVPVVSFAARLLREKGVLEFIEAARILRTRGVDARFRVIGAPDPGNPESVTESDVVAWKEEGSVEVLGYRNDIAALFAESVIVVLPSYYGEGLPKVLVEAAACGRAVITTDHPGCRDAIEPDRTGLLVPVRDPVALADAIQRLIENPDLRRRMGRAGRALAEREFAIEKVVDAHLTVYRELLSKAAA